MYPLGNSAGSAAQRPSRRAQDEQASADEFACNTRHAWAIPLGAAHMQRPRDIATNLPNAHSEVNLLTKVLADIRAIVSVHGAGWALLRHLRGCRLCRLSFLLTTPGFVLRC
jgi:hypothetical protein